MKQMASMCLMLVLAFPAAIFSQGWPEDSGSYFLKASQSWTIYNQFFQEDGRKVNVDRTRSFGISSIYGQYGLTDRLTFKAYVPFFVKSTVFARQNAFSGQLLQAGEKNTGLGDLTTSLQYAIKRNQIILSAALILGIPTGEYDLNDTQNPTGDGEFNQQVNLGVAGSFLIGGIYPFSSLFVGYNNRTNGFSDEWHAAFKLGTNWNRVLVVSELYTIQSFFNGEFNEVLVYGGGIVGNNAEMVTLNLQFAYRVYDELYFSFQLSRPLAGRYYFADNLYEVGIFIKGGN
jgi:hypothetical protein